MGNTRIALVASTAGAQAEIPSSSDANRKRAGPLSLPTVTTKLPLPLKTMPVGLPVRPAIADGIVTTSDCGWPSPSYRVDTPVWLSATQTKPNGLKAMPHGLTRCGSTFSALASAVSATRLRCW